MAARTVTVLAPNGRRQIVKCTQNTTLLRVLEEVCSKQGFEPIEYDIKHHNKVLDTSQTMQFSGLPNNAMLEMCPASKTRKETEVTVALNLEDGSRILGTFSPSSTLSEILTTLYDSNEPNPVVIYMRREIYGEDLSKTNLRNLGLTKGRAMFRIVHRAPEELKTQANVSSAIPAKPVEEKPFKRIFQPVDTPQSSNVPNTVDETKFLPTSKNVSVQPDILQLAKEEKHQKENVVVPEKESREASFIEETENQHPSQSPPVSQEQIDKNLLENVRLEDFPFLGTRNGLIFPLESMQLWPQEDPPDEFYNVTIEDAKVILRDIRRSRENAEEGGPLLTSQLRQLEESKKQLRQLNRYTKCIIRVLFPNRTVLQGVFSPTDFVNAVVEFVAEHLANSDTPFYLYTTPPKFVLPSDKRLIEVDCVPGALLHFGTVEGYKNVDYIREDLKDKYTTNSLASLAAVKIRAEAKRDRDRSSVDASAVPGCSKDPDYSSNQNEKKSNTAEKVPKWFKGT